MKIRPILLLFAICSLTACSIQTGSTIRDSSLTLAPNSSSTLAPNLSSTLAPNLSSTLAPNSSPAFQAELSSAISVQLTWTPVNGADKHLIEVSFGDDFFPIAYLDAGQTSFEHFPVPEESELTYRLRTYSGSEEISKEQTLSISTPKIETNALTVQANAYQPISSMANFEMPVTDPSDPNFDPEAFANLVTINPDTGEIDPQMLTGEPVDSVEEIGPDGGTISVSAPDGINYQLIFPAGALEETTSITLTPIESIDDLPLENFLGAVDIQPAGLVLEVPARLTIDFPEAIDVPEGMVTMNFAYTGSGSDFHFVPYLEGGGLASNTHSMGGILAKLTLYPASAGPLSGIAIEQLGGRGVGNGSRVKVRSTVKNRIPSTRSSRRENAAAVTQIEDDLAPLLPIPEELAPLLPIPDELAPILPLPLNQVVHEITAKISAVNTPDELGGAITDFSSYIYNYGNLSILKDINEKLWNQLTDKTYKVFDAHKNECLTKDSFNIQAIASKMINASNGFWKIFHDRYVARQGDSLLKEISDLINKCKFELDMESNISLVVDGVKTHAHAGTTVPFKLYLLILMVPPSLREAGVLNIWSLFEWTDRTVPMS